MAFRSTCDAPKCRKTADPRYRGFCPDHANYPYTHTEEKPKKIRLSSPQLSLLEDIALCGRVGMTVRFRTQWRTRDKLSVLGLIVVKGRDARCYLTPEGKDFWKSYRAARDKAIRQTIVEGDYDHD